MSVAEFLGQPLILAATGFLLIGAAAVIYVMKTGGSISTGGGKGKKFVILLRNKDRRYKNIPISNETDEALESTKDKKGITRHFVKRGASWTNEDRAETMFLGFNAYKYTLNLDGKLNETLRLYEAMRIAIGAELYNLMPPQYKEKLEKAELGITVEPIDPAVTGATLTGNEARHTESDHAMIDYYASKVKQALQSKMQWTNVIMGVSIGIVVGIMLVSFGVIKLG